GVCGWDVSLKGRRSDQDGSILQDLAARLVVEDADTSRCRRDPMRSNAKRDQEERVDSAVGQGEDLSVPQHRGRSVLDGLWHVWNGRGGQPLVRRRIEYFGRSIIRWSIWRTRRNVLASA